MSRKSDFEKISIAISSYLKFIADKAIVGHGDSLSILKLIPDQSISLILTDPPYHSTQKSNIYGDKAFKEDQQYLDWMGKYINEWRRVLKPNGSIFCFCSPSMSSKIENLFSNKFNILSNIVWTKPNDPGFDGWKQKMKKEALRQWYPHTERIIFAEPAFRGNLHRSYFGNLLRELRVKAELSGHQLTEIIGAFGRINHGGAVSNWEAGRNIPSREQYDKICKALISTKKIKNMPNYEDVIRPFKMDATKEFTDVWNFSSVKPFIGKHPAEKPINLLEHAISATTYTDDIVLDCFGGSGSTSIAALKLGRFAISLEIEESWVNKIIDKIKLFTQIEKELPNEFKSQKSRNENNISPQVLLFNI